MPNLVNIDVSTAAIAQRVADAFKIQFKADYDIAKAANPSITDAAFGKQVIIKFIKEVVKAAEANAAAEAARTAAINTANSEVNPT